MKTADLQSGKPEQVIVKNKMLIVHRVLFLSTLMES